MIEFDPTIKDNYQYDIWNRAEQSIKSKIDLFFSYFKHSNSSN